MHLLETDWFLRLVQKSGNTPQAKLIGMFDVVADWLEAPQIGNQLSALDVYAHPPATLLNFLTAEAKACGAALPEALANQLYFMLMCGVRDYAHQKHSLPIARQTAEALIQAQSQPSNSRQPLYRYAIAGLASVAVISASLAAFLLLQPSHNYTDKLANLTMSKPSQASNIMLGSSSPTIATVINHDASPSQTAEMFAKIEQMRNGSCIYPEVLMLPQQQRDVYLKSVVHGQIPTNIEDLLLMTKLLEKVRCNYTPKLMQNSVG